MTRTKRVVGLTGCLVVPLALLLCFCVLLTRSQCCPDRNLIKAGMTGDEVLAILGQPKHKDVRADGEAFWYYDCDGFLTGPPISVYFGKDSRVNHVFIVD